MTTPLALSTAWTVFRKELVDALRDRRTLMMVMLSSVAIGPVILVALSMLIASIEQRAEQREVVIAGLEHAPTLANYLQRQTFTLTNAPPDYEDQLQKSRLAHPVLVIGRDFEAELARGDAPLVEVVSSAANTRASTGTARLQRALRGFASEQATLRLAMRGVAPSAAVDVIDVQERDLASPRSRAARFTGMLPFFVLMAVLYGALNAALDTTAGERERGSLEPLLMNPATRGSIVLGKWGAVASLGMMIALVSSFSFLPAQWLLKSESLAALFQFGWREATMFLALLLPLAAALSALMMAIAIRSKTFKEAQASNTVVILGVSLLPLMTLFNDGGELAWHLWVPALGQVALMNRVLKGEPVAALDMLGPLVVCAAITVLGLVYVARQLRHAALR